MKYRSLAIVVGLVVVVIAAAALILISGEPGPAPVITGDAGVERGGECVVCGMKVRASDRWAGRVLFEDGLERFFCSPRCLLVYTRTWLKEKGEGARRGRDQIKEMQVKDYFKARSLDARGVVYVHGSDVAGPMGHDLVPFLSSKEAEQFIADHGGKTVSYSEIDKRLIDLVIAGRSMGAVRDPEVPVTP